MRLGLIDAVWAGSTLEGLAGSRKARELGFATVDLDIDPLAFDDRERSRMVAEIDELGIPVVSIICIAFGISDFNSAVARFHVERARAHVDFAVEIGAENILLVIGEYPWRAEVIPKAEQWKTAVDNVRLVSEYAQERGVKIALELEPFEFAIVNSIGLLGKFLDDVGVEALQANLDLNHLWPMRIEATEISELAGKICHAHISDCRGEVYENTPPGTGTAPLRDYLEALVATGYDGVLSLELGPAPESIDSVEWVSEGYRNTVNLMAEVGIQRIDA